MHPGRDPIGDGVDPVRLGLVGKPGEGQLGQRLRRRLEGDDAGKHAAVELRQHDMHRQVGGAKPTRAVGPGGAPGGGDDSLQHRHAGLVERRRLIGARGGGEGRGGDDQRRLKPAHARRGGTPPTRRPSGW